MSTDLLEAPAKSQAPATVPFNTKPIVYGIAEKRIAELASMYLKLKVEGIEDKTGLTVVHDARMTIKQHRVDIEKTRKALKEDALRYGQTVDAEAKRLTALLEPIEAHLQAEEDRIAAEKKRIREEAEQKRHEAVLARMNKLIGVNCTLFNYVQVQDMSEEVFAEKLGEATEAHRVAQEKAAAEKAERARLAEIERQRVEAECLEQEQRRVEEDARREAEAELLRKERAELEQRKAEEARQRHEAEERAAQERADLERQRREQQAEAERLAAERRQLEEEQARRRQAEDEQREREAQAQRERDEAKALADMRERAKEIDAAEQKRRRERDAADLQQALSDFSVRAPDDVVDAYEQFKLSIMRHKAEQWTLISRDDMRAGIVLLLGLIGTDESSS
jgi:hypothetical protein